MQPPPLSSSSLPSRIPPGATTHSKPHSISPPLKLNPELHSQVAVPGGFAPSIGGVAVTTAPWAKPPTGPSGFGSFGSGSSGGSSRSEDLGTSPIIVSPVGEETEIPPVLARVRSGSVTEAETGSLAGGKVEQYTNHKNKEGVLQP